MATVAKEKAKVSGATLGDIGSAAGEVWHYLNANGPGVAETIKRKVNLTSDVFYAAVGWLAREGKVHITGDGKKVSIGLR